MLDLLHGTGRAIAGNIPLLEGLTKNQSLGKSMMLLRNILGQLLDSRKLTYTFLFCWFRGTVECSLSAMDQAG